MRHLSCFILLFLLFTLSCNENKSVESSTSQSETQETKSNKLSTEVAMAILQKNFEKKCKQKLWIALDTHRNRFDDRQKLQDLEQIYKKLQQQGLLTIKDYGDFFQANFTNKGLSKYGIRNIYKDQVTVAQSEIVQIIGISQTDNDATVRFSYRYVPSELYNMRRHFNYPKKDNCPNGIIEEKVKFKKYDTGWLIEN